MAVRISQRHRVKVSVTVEPVLLHAVDDFVARHEGMDRSKVFDEALYLWYAHKQEEEIATQHRAQQSPEEQEERAAWQRIQTESAQRIFGVRERGE